MNTPHPVQTMQQRRALSTYNATRRNQHRNVIPFPTMQPAEPIQPEACQMCAEVDSDGTDGPSWFWKLLAVAFLTGYITTMIWRFYE